LTPNRTPAFIPNKWADLGTGGADPIRVKTDISKILCGSRKLAGKNENKEIGGKIQWNTEHDKIVQYFPHRLGRIFDFWASVRRGLLIRKMTGVAQIWAVFSQGESDGLI
jgi:hypothetical protein